MGGQHRSPWPGTLAAGAALVLGAWMLHGGGLVLPPLPTAQQGVDALGLPIVVAPPMPRAAPTRIRIRSAGVDAPVTGLALDDDGRLQPPPEDDANLAGWYAAGAAPGESGTAVLAGHVDTSSGPAVFYRLGTLHRGDQVEIVRADRSTAYFAVDGVEVYPKKEFPDRKVYAAAPNAQLRLITCGGGFTRQTGYDGNVVVYAHLVRADAA
ncbi:class F sortase [Kitasatospora sp. NPDC085879]|uniref:class F sortase n=1 Tax=Kitasatospora sp. NPDC085879 TaxID=3154769 RepID=UPI003424F661